jgi:hypothetical protein
VPSRLSFFFAPSREINSLDPSLGASALSKASRQSAFVAPLELIRFGSNL